MTQSDAILALDQGTTSSRAIVFDASGTALSSAQYEFDQLYPQSGWVEHDPEKIWSSTVSAAQKALAAASDRGLNVRGIGITNQRETTLVWDRATGQPVYNAIVWQDRRTADVCNRLKSQGLESMIREKTGLLLDPYFSASKVAWILDNCAGVRQRAHQGDVLFGTVDTYLIWRLTGGHVHATDVTNASRTSLFNIHTCAWDDELLDVFGVPKACLPEVRECTSDFGTTVPALFGMRLPIAGVAGDQQAAAIGQAGFHPGAVKSTYGTGCFALVNTGDKPLGSNNRLLTTIGYSIHGKLSYALEGAIFSVGATIQWLRDELKIIESAAQSEDLARSVPDNGGVYLVPAFAGLGAPYWRSDVRATISGLSRGSGRAHIVRAALESVAYQTADLFQAMQADGVDIHSVRIDGGMVANDWLHQFLADVLQIPVERPTVMETTALGAAYLAGLQLGVFPDVFVVARNWQLDTVTAPQMSVADRDRLMASWANAMERTLAVETD